jgi:hypothetical protein
MSAVLATRAKATPPSIAIEALVLGGPERCVEQHAQGVPRVRYVPPPEAPREVHVRQVTLLLRGETPPRRARVRAAAAAAAASSGPIGTIGLL